MLEEEMIKKSICQCNPKIFFGNQFSTWTCAICTSNGTPVTIVAKIIMYCVIFKCPVVRSLEGADYTDIIWHMFFITGTCISQFDKCTVHNLNQRTEFPGTVNAKLQCQFWNKRQQEPQSWPEQSFFSYFINSNYCDKDQLPWVPYLGMKLSHQ